MNEKEVKIIPGKGWNDEIRSLILHSNRHDGFGDWGDAHIQMFELSIESEKVKSHIAIMDETIVGYSCGIDYPHATHLDFLVVHPKHRKKGIGTKLIEYWKSIAKDGHLVLCTWTGYGNYNIGFYQRVSFEITGYSKNMYGDGDDQIFMTWEGNQQITREDCGVPNEQGNPKPAVWKKCSVCNKESYLLKDGKCPKCNGDVKEKFNPITDNLPYCRCPNCDVALTYYDHRDMKYCPECGKSLIPKE